MINSLYESFMCKNSNSSIWNFDGPIIHRKIGRGQYVNTLFCQYDNPPIEIANIRAKHHGAEYEVYISAWNLSKETRNQPIRIRYRVLTPEKSEVHDLIDNITPAPASRVLCVKFKYEGAEKPIFEIID